MTGSRILECMKEDLEDMETTYGHDDDRTIRCAEQIEKYEDLLTHDSVYEHVGKRDMAYAHR